ncbi:MAG: hypothetical protein ABW168_21945 [Sedimenticola sp.]
MSNIPKQWKLTEEESFSSFTSWQQNLVYLLTQDKNFRPFLLKDATWNKESPTAPNRGFTDDDEFSAAQKSSNLYQMLGLVAQWVPHYLCTDIVKNSTSMPSIWQIIRKYYGFQQSETQFMKFATIVWEDGERPERLYQRIIAHLQDNLLVQDSKLMHDGEHVTSPEVMSPTVERLAVLKWMELIHPHLPALVQRTFAFDLQRMTLKDLQPQIVDALDGFLEELNHEDVKSSRVSFGSRGRGSAKSRTSNYRPRSRPPSRVRKQCRICKSEGRRYFGHSISECEYLTHYERMDLHGIKSYNVVADDYEDPEDVTMETGMEDPHADS